MSRGRRSSTAVDLAGATKRWDPYLVATLRHTTFPWYGEPSGVRAVPLAESAAGSRDALSILGQIAAHYAFLRYARVSAGEFQAADWMVAFARGEDCRAIRVAGPAGPEVESSSPLEALEAAARILSAGDLDALRAPWGKPELVYAEIDLRFLKAADLRWFYAAAWGEITAPGPHLLREIMVDRRRRIAVDHSETASLLKSVTSGEASSAFVIGGEASPLVPFSAFSRIVAHLPAESRVGAAGDSLIRESAATPFAFAVTNLEQFDGESRALLDLLLRESRAGWLLPPEAAGSGPAVEGEATRFFVVSRRVAPLEDLRQELATLPIEHARSWLRRWTGSPAFREFLAQGTAAFPADGFAAGVPEPRRSFLAALALLGRRIEIDDASRFLLRIGCRLPAEELAEPPHVRVEDSTLVFRSESVRLRFLERIPLASRPALAAAALDLVSDPLIRASLYLANRNVESATAELERIPWERKGSGEIAEIFESFRSIVSTRPSLAAIAAASWVASGRYEDAESVLDVVPPSTRSLLRAMVARRRGRYQEAYGILEAETSPSPGHQLLRAEILRLFGRCSEARALLSSISPASPDEEGQLRFEKAMLEVDEGRVVAVDAGLPAARGLRTAGYVALLEQKHAEATRWFTAALCSSRDFVERVDVTLDLVYTHFVSGEWDLARYAALEALSICEESPGDRASAGILFTLAYLDADGGHWAGASARLERLETFYRSTEDRRRLAELNVVRSHLALCRLDLEAATRLASLALGDGLSTDLREAAALVIDEAGFMAGRDLPLQSTGRASCVTLRQRHLALRSRADGNPGEALTDPFLRALVASELSALRGSPWTPPEPASPSEALLLLRSGAALERRVTDPDRTRTVRLLAARFDLQWSPPSSFHRESGEPSREIDILRAIAESPFPFGEAPILGLHWRLASRNRLDHWIEEGSLPPLGEDAVGVASEGWLDCGGTALFWLAGLDGLSEPLKQAVAALVRIRIDHSRLDRLVRLEGEAREQRGVEVRGLVAASEVMQRLVARVGLVARSDVPVCIRGESGTGKELIARAIHTGSPRRSRPFVAVNCAALPEHLIESELFGHVRGAFTGADRDRAGLIESSDGGTLFLDEIGELPLPAQAKLLRFLQEGEFRRVGDTMQRTADVRIVAATNRKLEDAVDDRSFREDLYYRIEGIQLLVPPVRERGADVILLARHFLRIEHEKHRGGAGAIEPDAELLLGSYAWPGNVREIQNTIRAAHALAGESRRVAPEHLPERITSVHISGGMPGGYHDELFRFRRALIERSLQHADGNQSRAARALGVSRQALAYQIRELGILIAEKTL